MAHLTISVPAQLVDPLRHELVRAHADRASALARALERYLATHQRLDDLHGALIELTDLHDAIAQLGWQPAPEPQAVELTAHPEVLADALHTIDPQHTP
jgi:hypothetical protein